MAAGSNVYSSLTEKGKNSSGTVITTALYPLFLAEYGTKAQFCQKFHCNEAIATKDTQNRQVIQGLVEVGTAQYLMHAPKRLGKGRRTTKLANGVVKTYILLNDGGLNYYATGEVRHLTSMDGELGSDITNTLYRPRVNSLKIFIDGVSARYSSSKFTIEYRLTGEVYWTSTPMGNLGQNVTSTLWEFIYHVEKKGLYQWRVKAENEEGIWYSAIKSLDVYAVMFVSKHDSSYPSGTITGTQRIIYIEEREIKNYKEDGIGSVFYLDEACTQIAPLGYYLIGDLWYEFKNNILSNRIEVTRYGWKDSWPSDDPGYVPPKASLSINEYINVSLENGEYPRVNTASFIITNIGGIRADIKVVVTINTMPGYSEYSYDNSFSINAGDQKEFSLSGLPFVSYSTKPKLTIAITGNATTTQQYDLFDYTH